ncbi:PREDICTED: G2/mitotic-specific cyclin S13-7-like [Populus euphratica]|uniref:B-like cyclin n=1 Tax=Populus euphratica TaxID=75702 RepID=A0AAJ6V502_POPEU|nr:PREDICTED: G2/mitotic-specific cyclin S13-7-like [Populus euphratica]
MASRVQQQQAIRGEAVVGVNKNVKKIAAAAEGKNRRVLGDIGNLVTVRGIEGRQQPNRPVTRSFGAQLLANAQAAAAAENNKKQVCVKAEKVPAAGVDGVAAEARKVAVRKPAQKKVTVKPKPEEVTEISPDTEEKPGNKKKEGEGSSKKNKPTLSSVLTARSKAACGVANKPKGQVIDIDAADVNNDLAGVEYVEDIYKFYKLVENESRPNDYMDRQPEINEKMRAILVDWLIDVQHKFELSPETLYLTINIIDRFLSVKTVPRKELQLVGMSATLMASKYEEIWAPEVNDLVCISDRAYTHEQILVMEKTILANLEWTLTVPTHYVFLARFIKASIPENGVENMVYFLAELGLMHYDTVMFCPSMVAASAVYVARCTLNKTPSWTDTLKKHTGFSEPQLKDCAGLLVYFHSKAAEHRLQSVYRKYSKPERGAVALLPPAKSLLPGGLS